MSWRDNPLEQLVGTQVSEVYLNDEYLVFVTNKGTVSAEVMGDCCSTSYFHDLIGIDKLLAGPVVSVAEIPMEVTGPLREYSEEVQAYGYEIVTEHPEFGEVTTVLSFRNNSNGYYGGWMQGCSLPDLSSLHRITEDVLNTELLEATS